MKMRSLGVSGSFGKVENEWELHLTLGIEIDGQKSKTHVHPTHPPL